MTMKEVIEEIKLEITGGLLELEIEDPAIELAIRKAMRELERFWDETTMVTVPFSSCIDLTDSELDLKENANAIVDVFRTDAVGDVEGNGINDPMFAQQWMLFSNAGTMYNLNEYLLNYASWNTLLQTKNTISTDMAFKEDKHNNKLYINHYMDVPRFVTIEYIPKLKNVEDIQSDYWIDVLVKLSIAIVKIMLGRIRTRFSLSNALWSQDGETILNEGKEELAALREQLRISDNLILPID